MNASAVSDSADALADNPDKFDYLIYGTFIYNFFLIFISLSVLASKLRKNSLKLCFKEFIPLLSGALSVYFDVELLFKKKFMFSSFLVFGEGSPQIWEDEFFNNVFI